jgi:hypothetical protein
MLTKGGLPQFPHRLHSRDLSSMPAVCLGHHDSMVRHHGVFKTPSVFIYFQLVSLSNNSLKEKQPGCCPVPNLPAATRSRVSKPGRPPQNLGTAPGRGRPCHTSRLAHAQQGILIAAARSKFCQERLASKMEGLPQAGRVAVCRIHWCWQCWLGLTYMHAWFIVAVVVLWRGSKGLAH